MAATLLASACPAVICVGSMVPVATGTPPSQTVITNSNYGIAFETKNQCIVDVRNRYLSCGIFGILNGLVISIGTGLNVNVTAGQGDAGGLVQLTTATAVAVPASTSRVWIWLLKGTTSDAPTLVVTTSTAPPSGSPILLGSCVTGASTVTSVDFSGVVQITGAKPYRLTADNGVPSDNPPSGAFGLYTKTAWRGYDWDGTLWQPVGAKSSTTDPTSPATGETWFRTDSGALKLWNGSSVVSTTPS